MTASRGIRQHGKGMLRSAPDSRADSDVIPHRIDPALSLWGARSPLDLGSEGGTNVFCMSLAWPWFRIVRPAADERAETTLRTSAECVKGLGGVPGRAYYRAQLGLNLRIVDLGRLPARVGAGRAGPDRRGRPWRGCRGP